MGPCVPLSGCGPVARSLPGFFLGERHEVGGLDVGRAAGRGLGAVDTVT